MAYSIEILNNSLKSSASIEENYLEYQIIAETVEEMQKISTCEINLTSVVDLSHDVWEKIEGSISVSNKKIKTELFYRTKGILKFSELPQITTLKFSFKIEKIKPSDKAKDSGEECITVKLGKKTGPPNARELASLDAKVQIAARTPKIDFLHLNPSIIKPLGKIELSWKCTDIDGYEIQYGNGLNVSRSLPAVEQNSVTGCVQVQSLEQIKNNESFFIKATLDGEKVTTEINKKVIKIVETSEWIPTIFDELDQKTNTPQISTIVNLVLNERSAKDHMIWALAHEEESPNEVVIWNSYDGLDWRPYTYTVEEKVGDEVKKVDKKIVVPLEFIDSPVLFFGNDELCFIGGSKVAPGQGKNTPGEACNIMKRFSLSTNLWLEDQTAPWEARMGHSCVIFPDSDNNDTIWVIGGADKNGNGLNDIWCWDGIQWTCKNDIIVEPIPFPKRCLFSATVCTTKAQKKELWIGGGIDSFNGDPVNDIWKYNGESWQQIQTKANNELSPLYLAENTWIKTSALTDFNTKIVVIVIDVKQNHIYKQLESIPPESNGIQYGVGDHKLGSPSGKWANERNSNYTYVLITRSFNGCIWLLAKEYVQEGEISNSALYYSVPDTTGK